MAVGLKPKGAKPAGVYWVRRAIVLIPVLLVIITVIWLITTLSGPEKQEGLPTVPADTTTANPAACNPANIDLDVTAFQKIKASAEQTTFSVTATNTATQVCLIDVTKENSSATIVSGKDEIWSTADCPDAIKPANGPVDPGSAQEWSLDWTLRRSSEGCKLAKAELKPGTYQVKVTWGASSARKAFQIVK